MPGFAICMGLMTNHDERNSRPAGAKTVALLEDAMRHRGDQIKIRKRHDANLAAAGYFGDTGKEATWIVHQNSLQHFLRHAGLTQLRDDHSQRLGVAGTAIALQIRGECEVRSEQQVVGKAGLQQCKHRRQLHRIARSALAIVAHECTSLADGHGHIGARIGKAADMPDDDPRGVYANFLEQVELLHGTFAVVGVCKDGQIRLEMRPTDGAKDLALQIAHVMPGSNLAEYAHRLTARLIHQFPHNLSLAPLGQQWGINRLRIEAESGDDGHSGPRRQLLQEFQIPAHVGMASIDYAGDTLAPCRGQFCKHQVEIVRGTEHGLLGHGGISDTWKVLTAISHSLLGTLFRLMIWNLSPPRTPCCAYTKP